MASEELRQMLAHYYAERRDKNRAFSLRAMARTFGTSPAQLSQVMSGKRAVTAKFMSKVQEKLGLSPIEIRNIIENKNSQSKSSIQFGLIEENKFRLVADWYHFAILSLSKTPECRADPRWISERLGIDEITARTAFERLRNLGLIMVEKGRYVQISDPIHTTNDIPSAAIRKSHKQNLELAALRLDEVGVDEREFGSVTMAVNLKKLPLAKKLIRKFKAEIYQLLETGRRDEVYTLAIQLFPVSRKQGEK